MPWCQMESPKKEVGSQKKKAKKKVTHHGLEKKVENQGNGSQLRMGQKKEKKREPRRPFLVTTNGIMNGTKAWKLEKGS